MLSYAALTDAYADADLATAEDRPSTEKRRRRRSAQTPHEEEPVQPPAAVPVANRAKSSATIPPSPWSDWDHVLPYAVVLVIIIAFGFLYDMCTALHEIRNELVARRLRSGPALQY